MHQYLVFYYNKYLENVFHKFAKEIANKKILNNDK